MAIANTSIVAVILATLVGFAASLVWYRAFSTPWRMALGRTDSAKTKPGAYIVAVIALFVMAYVLGALVGDAGAVTMEGGIVVGALVWLGFVATSIAVNDSFAGSPVTLTLIDAGHWLVVLVLMGATIGLFSGGA